MPKPFDTTVTVDWSGGNAKSTTPSADAIWVSVVRDGVQDRPQYFASRQAVEPWLESLIDQTLTHGRRILTGFDFAFGYPTGATEHITGSPDPLAYWGWLEDRIEDDLKSNNRFDVAGQINATFDGVGPFWGNALKRDIPHLPRKGSTRHSHGCVERRHVETYERRAFSVWQLAGAGAVGSQVLMGLPVLSRLRERFIGQVSVWPFETLDTDVAFIEIWPSLFNQQIKAANLTDWIKDAAQVHVTADIIAGMSPSELTQTLNVPPNPEGWIFGVIP